jgi:hypothetical protein
MATTGFYWGANNPYLRPIWVKVRRAPKGLNPNIALIQTVPGQWDANPAHMIFECMTNRDWGMGANTGQFNIPSFEACAQTLSVEKFGLSMMWTREASIEDFITEIIDHIHATLFVDPRTGRWTLKLLRDDFDIDNIREINPSNATLSNFQRKLWGETANEMVVTYTDPRSEGDASLAAQDIANVHMQGGVISSGRNYYGIRNKDLAARVAERDLRGASQPLAVCDVELNRTMWDLVPGDVLKLHWPEKGIDQVIMRVGVIDYGDAKSGVIKTTLHEDIFSMAAASYLAPPDTDWVDPSTDPAPLQHALVHTAPAFIAANALSVTDASSIEYPEVITLILASQNSADDQDFELIAEMPQSNGSIMWTSLGAKQFADGAALASAFVAEAETSVTTWSDASGGSPLAGSLIFIGDTAESAHEIALVKTVTESGWTLQRGVLDTVPKAWPIGTRVWVASVDITTTDNTLRAASETVDYRPLPRTSNGTLDFEDAPDETVTLTARPHLPNRPANVKANGVGFGSVAAVGSTITVTWANRNRLLEMTQVLGWTDGTVAPEAGQTTTIYALAPDGTVLGQVNGLTGTSHAFSVAPFAGQSSGRIRVTSKRGGLESLQGHEIVISSFTSDTLGLSGETGALLLSGDMQSGTDKLRLGAE